MIKIVTVLLLGLLLQAPAQASQCATLYSQWTGYIQFANVATPSGGLSACGYVYLSGSEYAALQSNGTLTDAQKLENAKDGMALGWLVALLMVASWGFTQVRKQL